jgi:hypothetical protein
VRTVSYITMLIVFGYTNRMISSGIPAKLLSAAGGAASATVAANFCRLVALPGAEATEVVSTSPVHSGEQTSSFHGNCKSMKQILSGVEKDKGRPRANMIRAATTEVPAQCVHFGNRVLSELEVHCAHCERYT